MSYSRVGFIGAGKMAAALAKGFIDGGRLDASQALACDPFPAARESFEAATGIAVTDDNEKTLRESDALFLCVKPYQLGEVFRANGAVALTERQLVVSILAGTPLAALGKASGGICRVIRAMPNTPALVGRSATAIAPGATATEEDVAWVASMFEAVGLLERVPETLIDAVTGVSGSGPAYVYQFIEALSDAGVAEGLARDVATRLAAQTVLGAATMVLETGRHPGELKDMVTSAGGTTIEAICELERSGFRGATINAVRAAARRSREMSQ